MRKVAFPRLHSNSKVNLIAYGSGADQQLFLHPEVKKNRIVKDRNTAIIKQEFEDCHISSHVTVH